LVSGKLATLGKTLVAYDFNSPDCPVSQRPPAQRSAASTTVGRQIRGRSVARSNGRQGAPDCPVRQLTKSATVGCAIKGRRSRTGQLQGMSGGTPDCPVCHPTEGKISLPKLPPTAPSCLEAIKGTPRRMEEEQAFFDHSKALRLHFHAFDSLR
jgi:hypothetical protein